MISEFLLRAFCFGIIATYEYIVIARKCGRVNHQKQFMVLRVFRHFYFQGNVRWINSPNESVLPGDKKEACPLKNPKDWKYQQDFSLLD